jgi:hypothetical protein
LVRRNGESARLKTAAFGRGLGARPGLEPARPFGQRILSSRFAQNHAIRGNGTLYNLLTLLVCNRPALFGFEYTVGQIWDKSIFHGFRKGPIHIREGAKKPFSEYCNEGACHARTKTKKPFLKFFEKIERGLLEY